MGNDRWSVLAGSPEQLRAFVREGRIAVPPAKRVASPLTLLIPRGDDRGCYPPGPDAADSDCYQSDVDLDDGCYHSGEEILRSLIGQPRGTTLP